VTHEFSINIFADFVPVYTKSKSILKLFCCTSFGALSKVSSSSLLKKGFLLFFDAESSWRWPQYCLRERFKLLAALSVHVLANIGGTGSAVPRLRAPLLSWDASCCKARAKHLQSVRLLPSHTTSSTTIAQAAVFQALSPPDHAMALVHA